MSKETGRWSGKNPMPDVHIKSQHMHEITKWVYMQSKQQDKKKKKQARDTC